ncbi:MFS transporter [Pullulanibacillus camelliae]|uniref:MFS transporter n=1 Tax=Pullulanibacillus camelliae TaxID=1707096 RepID=A0A8J2YKF7_9BACL|nr:nitrate/nitrite transporter [Pullulanibacillus camelliae]GGE50432.1 MFS transporter [Pullulanibacillus camelliae]
MKKSIQLPLQTISLTVAFMMWVLISSLLPNIKGDIQLTPTQASWVTAIPVILGSILRVPIGFYTNRFGSRSLFVFSFIILLVPVAYLSYAHSFLDLMISGFLLGVGGATFSIGVTSLPKYFPKEKHGTINGIYGVGNLGTAVTTFFAPILASIVGWNITVRLCLILLIVFAALNFIFGDNKEKREKHSLSEQFKGVYKNEKLWFLSIFYFITFGVFVAFTVYLPNFLVSSLDLSKVDAGIRTAGFIVIATLIRPVGGYLSDKFNPYGVLMFIFAGLTLSGVLLSFSLNLPLFTVGCLTIAVCAGIGNGAVFKLVPLHFSKQGGIVNGIVAAAGGLGGFFPPLILTTLYGITGHYAIGFMALSESALASFILVIWMAYREKLQLSKQIVDSTADGIMVTDLNGHIQSVNRAFTLVTGYREEEVTGKNVNILSSGKQDQSFYKTFWTSLREKGNWQGEIINKRKSGEIYQELLTVNTLEDSQGDPQGFVGIFSDVSKIEGNNPQKV